MKLANQREDLIFLLNQAAELEHGLACTYLFGAFSLKADRDEGLVPEAVPVVQNWKEVLRAVAIEEMGHLGVVSNLLTAIGAAPHFSRPNFPQPTNYYLPNYALTLEPFSEETLEHFIFVERPDVHDLQQVAEPKANEPVENPSENEIGPNPESFETVAALYEAIHDGLGELADRLSEERVFVARRQARKTAKHLTFGEFPPITDLASAFAALDSVIEEGEGDRGDRADSHYGRFRRIQEEFRHFKAADPSFRPALPVLANPFPRTPPLSTTTPNIMTNERAIAASDLFDATYGVMLQILSRYFGSGDEPGEELDVLAGLAIETMSEVLSPLGELLCRLPAHDNQEHTAGPTFGLYRVIHLLPHRHAAQLLFGERYEELASYASGLASGDSRFGPIAFKLEELAGRLPG